jgi:hypothetical protein
MKAAAEFASELDDFALCSTRCSATTTSAAAAAAAQRENQRAVLPK